MQKKLSIIIPVYNCQQYTDELLQILDSQITDEVEVLVIDDGSKTPFETNYSWVNLIRKENGGAASARNLGLDNAKGEYVSFIDGDDIVSDKYIETLINKIDTEHFDYCYLSWKSFGSWKCEVILKSLEDKFPPFNLCLWNRCYKRSLIGDIRLNEKKAIAEDAQFIKDVKETGKKSFVKDILYFYRSDTPNSLTKRFNNGELKMKRVVYYYDKITEDMDYLLDEVKSEHEDGEVIIMTNHNDIPELEQYAMVNKPFPVKGTELRGEFTNLFTKLKYPIESQIIIWAGAIYKMGGMESFLYYYCKTMSEYYNIMIIYTHLDDIQKDRLLPYAKLESYQPGEIYSCNTLIANRLLESVPSNIKYIHKIQMAHCCKINNMWQCKTDNDIAVFVSDTVRNTYKGQIKGHPSMIINNITAPDKPKRVLRLISATRLTYEKGGERMLQFAKGLRDNNIPFLWTIFSNDRLSEHIDGIAYASPTVNIIDYIKGNDYLVQLSDSEAFCYSIQEALMQKVPVITTPLPVLDELGIKEGVDRITVPFDMKDIDYKSIYKAKLKPTYKLDNDKIIDDWKSLLGDISGYNNEFNDLKTNKVKVKAKMTYKDLFLGRTINSGEIIEVINSRAELLKKKGIGEIIQ